MTHPHVANRLSAAVLSLVSIIAIVANNPLRAEVQPHFDITQMSLQELMDIQVTSVSKKSQKLYDTPAAIYVLTSEDIRRSGVTNIPDALRLVPGVEVARVDGNKYAVSIRGFLNPSANKLLVLIDGRPIYDLLYGSIFWESREFSMSNIERIEVIRGSAGSTWGANAVNGVVNIISKEASETQGLRISGGAGTKRRGFGSARYGWEMDSQTSLRVNARYVDEVEGFAEPVAFDTRQAGAFGLRLDRKLGEHDKLWFTGGYFTADVSEGTTPEQEFTAEHRGGHVTGAWSHTFNASNKLSVLGYFDNFDLRYRTFDEVRNTASIELRNELSPNSRHNIIWGGSYVYTADDVQIRPPSTIEFVPPQRQSDVLAGFFQDDFMILPDKLRFSGGIKIENNYYSGIEVQPSAGLSWFMNRSKVLWISAARAVRTPSRLEKDIEANGLRYGDQFDSENLITYQLGHRAIIASNLTLDAVGFVHDYKNLLSSETYGLGNEIYGQTYGAEFNSHYQLAEWWRLESGYSILRVKMHANEGSLSAPAVSNLEGYDPKNVASLQSRMNVTSYLELDGALRYVDNITTFSVPSYFVADVRIGWHPSNHVEISLAARDLFDPRHAEQIRANATEVEQSIFAKVTWEMP